MIQLRNYFPIVFLSGIFFISCSSNETQQEDKKDMQRGFKTDTIKLLNARKDYEFTGLINFDQTEVSRVFPLAGGNVIEVNAMLGDYVNKGQVLAKVRSGEAGNYVSDLLTAKANLALAKRKLDNAKELYEEQFSSTTDLIQAESEYQRAEYEYSRSANIASVYGINENEGVYSIKAPESGYVVEKNINPNNSIRSDDGTSLFTISNLKKVWVMINIYETDINEVKEGMKVEVKTLANPGRVFEGTIDKINQVLDNESRVLHARVELDNNDAALKPGMFASIILRKYIDKADLAVPLKSLVFDNNNYFIITYENNKYRTHKVEVVSTNSDYAFIKTDVPAGSIVISEGSLLLYNELN